MTIQANFPNVQPSLLLDFANAKQLPPSVNFTRATTATYYDGSTTAKAEQNFVADSQSFASSNWSVNSATKTSTSVTDPAGGSTALTLTKVSDNGYSLRYFTSAPCANRTFTLSFYLKGSGTVQIYMDNVVDQSINTIVTLSASWTRYTVTGTWNSTVSNASCGVAFTGGATATSVDVAFCQLEERSTATAYTATSGQPITNYIPVLLTAGGGQPRFDHNPTTSESLGLLIEEARTNVSLYSSYFASGWTRDFCSVTANSVVAPDGTLNAATLVEDTTTNFHLTYPAAVTSVAGTYTASVYLKQAGRRYAAVQIYINGATSRYTILVDLSNGSFVSSNTVGTPTSTSYSITSVGNGWYRVSVTAAQTSTSNLGIAFGAGNSATPSYSAGFPTYTGNGWDAIYFWGAQVEAGTFATSYIPTVAAAATRAADAASMTGANFTSWFNNSEGTTYAETSTIGGTNSVQYLGVYKFSDGTIANRFGLYGRPLAAGYGAVMTTNGTTVAGLEPVSGSTSTTVNTYSRLAYSYKVNEFSATRNASTVTTDTAGGVAAVNKLEIGIYDDVLNGYIKKLAYYPIAVTSAQLQALTS